VIPVGGGQFEALLSNPESAKLMTWHADRPDKADEKL
jgi:hypothetical protein